MISPFVFPPSQLHSVKMGTNENSRHCHFYWLLNVPTMISQEGESVATDWYQGAQPGQMSLLMGTGPAWMRVASMEERSDDVTFFMGHTYTHIRRPEPSCTVFTWPLLVPKSIWSYWSSLKPVVLQPLSMLEKFIRPLNKCYLFAPRVKPRQ